MMLLYEHNQIYNITLLYNHSLIHSPLEAEATLETIADMKLNHVNDSSLSEASATPPMTGSSVILTCHGRNDFINTADKPADTTYSIV